MKTTIEDCVGKEQCAMPAVSTINFFMKSGLGFAVPCALSEEDFIKVWNKSLFVVKVPGNTRQYIFIKKRYVAGFFVEAQGTEAVTFANAKASALQVAQSYITSHGMLEGDKNRWGQDPNFLPLLRAFLDAGGTLDELHGVVPTVKGRTQ